jgi:hypothetical protein
MVIQIQGGNAGHVVLEMLMLALVCVTLFVPFLAGGIALAKIFASQTERIGRLYAIDLPGAALGCAIVIPAITFISPPGTIFLSGLAFALAGLPLALCGGRATVVPAAAVAVGLLLGVLFPRVLPDPVRDVVKGRIDGGVFSQWSPVFRVDVVPLPGTTPQSNFLVHERSARLVDDPV